MPIIANSRVAIFITILEVVTIELKKTGDLVNDNYKFVKTLFFVILRIIALFYIGALFFEPFNLLSV